MSAEPFFTDAQLTIIKFCAKECELQQSGEVSVGWMLEAWQHALKRSQSEKRPWPTKTDVLLLAELVEPVKNLDGWRVVGVRVGYSVKAPWHLVPDLMARHMTMIGHATPEEWFREYEEIHPFRDGNGRTGQILYNWLRGSLGAPVFAPNFWDDERRIGLPSGGDT